MRGRKRVLVAVASKCGATDEIADRIAATLSHRGYEVSKRRVEDAGRPSDFDAVVLGSGIYAGRWLSKRPRLSRQTGMPSSPGPCGCSRVVGSVTRRCPERSRPTSAG